MGKKNRNKNTAAKPSQEPRGEDSKPQAKAKAEPTAVLPAQADLQRHVESKLATIRKSKRNVEQDIATLESLKKKLASIVEEEKFLEDQLDLLAA